MSWEKDVSVLSDANTLSKMREMTSKEASAATTMTMHNDEGIGRQKGTCYIAQMRRTYDQIQGQENKDMFKEER